LRCHERVGGKGFCNINTANGFHSYIKDRYNQYRGVATKYLNRYNALFSLSFHRGNELVDAIYKILMTNDSPRHHSVQNVKTRNILGILSLPNSYQPILRLIP